MSSMTKKTVAVYSRYILFDNSADIIFSKLNSMYSSGQTDGQSQDEYKFICVDSLEDVETITKTRFWIDQAAAEDWRDFIAKIDQEFDQGLIAISVLDL